MSKCWQNDISRISRLDLMDHTTTTFAREDLDSEPLIRCCVPSEFKITLKLEQRLVCTPSTVGQNCSWNVKNLFFFRNCPDKRGLTSLSKTLSDKTSFSDSLSSISLFLNSKRTNFDGSPGTFLLYSLFERGQRKLLFRVVNKAPHRLGLLYFDCVTDQRRDTRTWRPPGSNE